MKRSILLGMLALALPGAGCSTFSHAGMAGGTAAQTTAKQSALPNIATQSSDVETGIFLAQAQQARVAGDLTTAAKLLSQLVLVAPDDPRVLGEYGKVLAAQGRTDDALAFLERAIQLQPADWTFYSAQGVAYDREGKYPLAQASYAHALQLKPGEPAVLNNDALSHMQAGDLAGAENLLRQVSAQSPDYARVSQTLAAIERLKPTAPAAMAVEPARQIATVQSQMPEPVATSGALAPALASHDVALVTREPAALSIAEPLPEPEQPKPSTVLPAVTAARPALSAYEALKADPTVVMAPIRVDAEDAPRPAPRPIAPKQQVASAEQPAKHTDESGPTSRPIAPKPQLASAEPPAKHTDESRHDSAGSKIYVQAGAFLSDARARQAAAGLESLDVKIMPATVNGREVFRLRIGPFSTMSEAKTAFAEAQALGRSDLMIVKE